MKKYLFFLLLSLLFLSCKKNNTVFSETFPLHGQSWDYDSLVQFQVRVGDTSGLYQIWLKFDHTEKYPYANLWIKFIVIGPDSTASVDTVNIPFQDPEHRWLGIGIGKNWSLKQMFADSVRFKKTGTYTFLIQHIMRPEKLSDIKKIGIIIKKH